jgi:hypothetical protein
MYARFVVRADGGLIVGKSMGNLLKPDTVYEIVQIAGEFIVREVGTSTISNSPEYSDPRINVSWNNEVGEIVENGQHLYTRNEITAILHHKESKNDSSVTDPQ